MQNRNGFEKSSYLLFRSVVWLIGFTFFLSYHQTLAQLSITLQVVDSLGKYPLSFASVKAQAMFCQTNVSGEVFLSVPFKTQIEVNHPQYHTKFIFIDSLSGNYFVYLEKKYPFIPHLVSEPEALSIVEYVVKNKAKSTPAFTAHKYTKLKVSSEKTESSIVQKKWLSKILENKILGKYPTNELLLLEIATEKKFLDRINQTQAIKAVKSSDISVPMLVIENVQMSDISLFQNTIELLGKTYESPLSDKAYKTYCFNIIDTILWNAQKVICLKFHRSENYYFRALSGYLYISEKDKCLLAFKASPEHLINKGAFLINQSYTKIDNHIFPYQQLIRLGNEISKTSVKISASLYTEYSTTTDNQQLTKNDFDETIIDYPAKADLSNEPIWKIYRNSPLIRSDSATYLHYKKIDRKSFLQKSLRLGENIYFGFLPLGKINFLTNKFLNFNDVEKLRLGIGMETNQRFSDTHTYTAYVGYGLGDNRWKYGIGYSLLLEKTKDIKLASQFSRDLSEAGLPSFAFDRYQYSSESIRNFTLQIMDFTTEWKNQISAHPLRFLDLIAGLNISNRQNQYSYTFKSNTINSMQFTEFFLGSRWAFGERNIKYFEYTKTQPSIFPIIYFNLTSGWPILGADYTYSRFDLKIEETIRLFRIGTLGMQLLFTQTNGDAPYTKLFNGKGSLQNASVVVHNSFETMSFNEFLTNQFVGLFTSHDFGKFFTPYRFIQPNLILLHNMGVGSISNPAVHQNLPFQFKSMQKGYFETGLFLGNLIMLRINTFKLGIGIGLVRRYGAYAFSKSSENMVFKFAIHFRP